MLKLFGSVMELPSRNSIGVIGLILFCLAGSLYLFPSNSEYLEFEQSQREYQECRFELVESIPENLTFPAGSPSHASTYDAWMQLLQGAQANVDLGVFYWTLTSEDVKPGSAFPSAYQGEDVLQEMLNFGLRNGTTLRIAQTAPDKFNPQKNSAMLKMKGAAQVVDVPMKQLFNSVLHTKLWLVDEDTLYLGSANMDFRSLTQVKELGVVVRNCPVLASDARKIFQEYWFVGQHKRVPSQWPAQYSTSINRASPAKISVNGVNGTAFLSSSPPAFSAAGRTDDIAAILAVIADARHSVSVAVMDYYPRSLYERHVQFWPVIDDALRRAAVERGVAVRVLASHWPSTRKDMPHWLRSLADISVGGVNIQTKLFVVPKYTDEQRDIPFGRVNHNKYMVTDRVAYIGTSNWSQDYFTRTAGVGLVVNETHQPIARDSLRSQLQAVFDRDWNSEYAHSLDDVSALE